jgi:hypothetical protein
VSSFPSRSSRRPPSPVAADRPSVKTPTLPSIPTRCPTASSRVPSSRTRRVRTSSRPRCSPERYLIRISVYTDTGILAHSFRTPAHPSFVRLHAPLGYIAHIVLCNCFLGSTPRLLPPFLYRLPVHLESLKKTAAKIEEDDAILRNLSYHPSTANRTILVPPSSSFLPPTPPARWCTPPSRPHDHPRPRTLVPPPIQRVGGGPI